MRKWMIALVAVVAAGLVACGDDSDDSDGDSGLGGSGATGGSGGTGGTGGGNGGNNPCITNPMGDECMTCVEELESCWAGPCESEYTAVDECTECEDGNAQDCCSDEGIALYQCVQSECPAARPCFGG